MTLRVLKGAFVACLALAAMAAGAQAGQYHVYTCRTPSGESAPADGWSGSVAGASVYAEDTCRQGGALIAALGDRGKRTANTDIATWAFEAPRGETIAGATLWRAGDADGGAVVNAAYQFWLAGPTRNRHLRRMHLHAGIGVAGRRTGDSPFPVQIAWRCRPST